MMKINLLHYELCKLLFSKYVILFIVILLGVNVCLFSLLNKDEFTSAPITVDAVNQSLDYTARLDEVIEKANRNLLIYDSQGYSPDSYLMKSQKITISQYSRLYDSKFINGEINQGTSAIFTYNTDIILYLLAAVLAVTTIYYIDVEQGTIQFIHDTKYGGIHLRLSKMFCSLIVSSVLGLTFFFTDFLAMRIQCGAMPMSQPIQIYSQFVMCPYRITVGEAVLFGIFWRILFSMIISLFIGFFSVIVKRKLLTWSAFFMFTGVCFLISVIANERSLISGITLFHAADLSWQLETMRTLPIFSTAVKYLAGIISIWLVLGFMMVVAILIIPDNIRSSMPNKAFVGKKKKTDFIVNMQRKRSSDSLDVVCNKKKSQSFTLYELIKLTTPVKLSIVIFLVILKLVISYSAYHTESSYDTQLYKEYISKFTGALTENVIQEINDTRAGINQTYEDYDRYLIKYQNGQLSRDEYLMYKTEFYETKSFETIFERVEERVGYLSSLKETEEINGWILHDDGWVKLFSRTPDFILILLLITLLSDISSMEYGGMYQILHTVKNGRRPVMRAKLRIGILISITLGLLFFLIDIGFISYYHGLYAPCAPLASIMDLSVINDYPIVLVALFSIVSQLAGGVLISSIIVCLSTVLRKFSLTIALSALFIVLPYLLKIGHGGISGLLDGHTLMFVCLSKNINYGLITAYIMSILAAFMICTIVSKRSWGK